MIKTSPTPSSERSDANSTILVVDEERVFLDFMGRTLSDQGYTVLTAGGVAEAVRLAGATPAIHLLLTEFSMPEADGLELTRRFRTVHPEAPVLVVSASLERLDNRGHELDRFATLAKPFSLDGLIGKVRTLLAMTNPLPP
jgi:DNA-binding response OmpR family regulator